MTVKQANYRSVVVQEKPAEHTVGSKDSLRSQLLAVFRTMMLAMLFVMGIGVAFLIYRVEHSAWRERLGEASRNASREVAYLIENAQHSLSIMVNLGYDEINGHNETLLNMIKGDNWLSEVVFLNSNGVVLAHAYKNFPLLQNFFTIPQEQWFKEALTQKTFVGEIRNISNQEPSLIMTVTNQEGNILVGWLDMNNLWQTISKINLGKSGQAYVINRQGQIVAHKDRTLILSDSNLTNGFGVGDLLNYSNYSSFREFKNLKGISIVAASAPVVGINWVVITELPASEAYASTRIAILLLALGILVGFVLSSKITTDFLEQRVLRPIQQLYNGAIQFGQGNLGYNVEVLATNEIGQVAEAFNRMAAGLRERDSLLASQKEGLAEEISVRLQAESALRQAHDDLELRVHQRTAELGDINNELQTEIGERKRIEQELEKKASQQERLLETARHLTESIDLNQVLHKIVTSVKDMLETNSCAIYLLEGDGVTLTPVVAIDPLYETEVLATTLKVGSSFTGRAVLEGHGLIFNNAGIVDGGQHIPGTPLQEEEHVMVAPLIVEGHILGAMCLNHTSRPFMVDDLALTETLATYASAALKNAQAHAFLQQEVEERKLAEQALRQSEDRFRVLFDHSPVALWEEDCSGIKNELDSMRQAGIVDLKGYFFDHPEGVERLINKIKVSATNLITLEMYKAKTSEELLGNLDKVLENDSYKANLETITAIAEGRLQTHFETVNRTLTGERIHVSLNWRVAPGFEDTYSKVLVSIIDITDRNNAQESLQKKTYQQQRLIEIAHHLTESLDLQQVLRQIAMGAREILNATGCIIYLLEPDQRTLTPVVAVEPGFEEEILSTKLDIDHSFTGQGIKARRILVFNDVLSAGTGKQIPGTPVIMDERVMVAPFSLDNRATGAMCLNRIGTIFTPDDQVLAEMFAAYASTALKNAQSHAALQLEVEERKQAERDLRESEERYRSLFETNHSVMLVIDPVTQAIVDANPAACKYYGYTLEEVTQLRMTQINHRSESEVLKEMDQAEEDGRQYHHFQHLLANGEIREVDIYRGPVMVKGKRLVYSIVHDVTERFQREREMQAILEMSTALRGAQTRDDMFPVILNQVQKLLNISGATLLMRDIQTGEPFYALAVGSAAPLTGLRIKDDEGIGGLVLTTGKPYLNNNVGQDPRNISPRDVPTPKSLAAVPLIAHEETIGVLLFSRDTDIVETEVRLLAAVGEIAANAIHRVTLHEQTQLRLRRLDALHNIDKAISTNFNLEVVLNVVLEQAISQLGVDAAAVLMLEPGTQNLVFAGFSGFHSSYKMPREVQIGKGLAGRVALERKQLRIGDSRTINGEVKKEPGAAFLKSEGFCGYFGVPLMVKGQLKGVLELFQREEFEPDEEWLTFLDTLGRQTAIAIENATMFADLQRGNLELKVAYDTTLEGWAKALELRDKETEGHSQRVVEMTLTLGEIMGIRGEEFVSLRRGSILHDIGKMGIPDHILLKPGPLDEQEWGIMHQHPIFAFNLLSSIPFLGKALDIPYSHHENWDGTGYPCGLKGEQIPLTARIFAVVDVWDALCSDRPYRPAWNEADALEFIQQQSGKRFDPRAVEAFFQMRKNMHQG